MADGFFWDGYVHWARDIETKDRELKKLAGDRDDIYEPIFIRLDIPFNEETYRKVVDYFLDSYPVIRLDDPESGLASIDPSLSILNDFAFDFIEPIIGFQHAIVERKPPEFFVYRKVAKTPTEHRRANTLLEIIDVGAPARVFPERTRYEVDTPQPFTPPQAVGALIDNDIGFLNGAFRQRNPMKSRFSAIWLQAREKLAADVIRVFKSIHIGKILAARDIEQLIKVHGRDERGAYRALNTALHSRAAFKLPPPIAAHGTMVADLALGNVRDSSMPDVPLLGVQLPPEAAWDTSGTTSESYIVQGVRWICYWARVNFPGIPVVVNISYGVLAGQKDGGKFLEAQIAEEIRIAAKYQESQTVKVVFAYGNGRNERQVADVAVTEGTPQSLTWMIPADNPFPTFVELRAVGQDKLTDLPDTVSVRLTDPVGNTIQIAGSGTSGQISAEPRVTETGGTAAARLYNTPSRTVSRRPTQTGHTLAAVGPTRLRGHDLPTARAGNWQIELTNSDSSTPVRVILQIQRGDTAPGYRGGGRQSRFEGRLVPTRTGGFANVTVERPLTNSGTNSAFANAGSSLTVGAERNVFGAMVPAPYSGTGAFWTTKVDPDFTHAVDLAFTQGVLTSGAYSGTYARLSGTSAAAALQTRQEVLNP